MLKKIIIGVVVLLSAGCSAVGGLQKQDFPQTQTYTHTQAKDGSTSPAQGGGFTQSNGLAQSSRSEQSGLSSVLSQAVVISWPISNAEARVTKKPFGIKVSPANSPVNPERFSGFHTGVDFETFSDEQDADVQIMAICDGEILQKRNVEGYGGVVVESCKINNQEVTVVYGHLELSSIKQKDGEQFESGEAFAMLGSAFSNDTGGERKHLHLGIKKGKKIDVRGYVKFQSLLGDWLDFLAIK